MTDQHNDPVVDQIMTSVCTKHGVSLLHMRSRRRDRLVMKARKEFISLTRAKDYSLPKIGAALNRDHTVVLHHLQKMEAANAKTA